MPWSVHMILICLALLFCILSIMGKMPLWPAVLMLIIDQLVGFAGYTPYVR